MRKLTVLLVVSIAILLAMAPAYASGDVLNANAASTGACSATFITTGLHGDYNWSDKRSWSSQSLVNGAVVATGSGTLAAGPASYSIDASAGFGAQTFPYTYTFNWKVSGFGTVTLNANCSASGALPIVTVAGGSNNNPFWQPGDSRLNLDPDQPAALYCQSGNVEVWAINPTTQEGKFALEITRTEIDHVIASKPVQNTLIKSSPGGVYNLYYLPASNQLSFITWGFDGKQYSFVWGGC